MFACRELPAARHFISSIGFLIVAGIQIAWFQLVARPQGGAPESALLSQLGILSPTTFLWDGDLELSNIYLPTSKHFIMNS